MVLCDVNVLVYAFRSDADHHARCAAWLDGVVNSDEAFGVSDHVLSGFRRIVTHPQIWQQPSRPETALGFADAIRGAPTAVTILPGAPLAG